MYYRHKTNGTIYTKYRLERGGLASVTTAKTTAEYLVKDSHIEKSEEPFSEMIALEPYSDRWDMLNMMRMQYYSYRTNRYLFEHPGVSHEKAYKYARVAWAKKIKDWKKRGLIPEEKKDVTVS